LEKGSVKQVKEGLAFFEGREGKEKEVVRKILLRRKNEVRCWF